MRDVFNGAIVAFECLGDVHVPDHRFLDDVTDQGRIKLSPGFNPPFTGARWQCVSLPSGGFALVSAGAVHGLRYLDGRTQDGVVQGVGDALPPFSGTRWQIQELSPGVVTIKSLGDFHNAQHQFLDGHTQVNDGSVGLAPSTDPPFSGTKWATHAMPTASLEVHTQRQQTGSDITITGRNFTPRDGITFAAEGIVGHGGVNHAPLALGVVATADGSGSFNAFVRVSFVSTQPADAQVVIRATDHSGRTASGFSNGFHP
jgi:hypothetical protein